MRTAVCVWTVLLALVLGASETRAQTFPRDDQWRVLECDGVASFDPVADEPAAVDERDVVGDSRSPRSTTSRTRTSSSCGCAWRPIRG